MCPDEMPRSQGAAEAELAGQNTGSHDPSKAASIVARVGGVGAFDSQKIKHRTLRFKNSAASDCANLNGWHGDTNLKITIVTTICQ